MSPLRLAYAGVFFLAAGGCFVGARWTRDIGDPDTQRGLRWLLFTSGGWAVAHTAFFLVPSRLFKLISYEAGLVVGLSTVGPWLYFCSAYSNRTLHRNTTLQRVAVGVFLGIVLVKLTNPFHHLYFQAELVTMPFRHLAIRHQLLHWLVVGLSYGLAMVGYFMLLERLAQVNYDTRPLVGLVGITGLPLVFDLIGFTTPYLVDITYEPIGVAVFSLGVLFFYRTRFQAVQITGSRETPVLLLDDAGLIREYNNQAERLFSNLSPGVSIDVVSPDLKSALQSDEGIIAVDKDDGTRYYQVSASPIAAGRAELGRVVICNDVTEREQYRRELEQQVEQLEQFASVLSHDLREPLQAAQAKTRLLRKEYDNERLAELDTVHTRMADLIEDVLTLARQGRSIGQTEDIELGTVAQAAWATVEAPPTAELSQAFDTVRLEADEERLQTLLENLFQNAVTHAGPTVRIEIGILNDENGFYVEDDGEGIPPEQREAVFEHGHTTSETGHGIGLVICKQIAEAHGWSITATESDSGGARFEITGVTWI